MMFTRSVVAMVAIGYGVGAFSSTIAFPAESRNAPRPQRAATAGQESTRITSLTIFPVTAVGGQHRNFAEAVGLLVEKAGFRKIKIAEIPFRPREGADFDKIASAFGVFVTEHPISTQYALYGEFQGTPRGGVEGVRGVVVDGKGKVVWKDVQTPRDSDFKRLQPRDPMTCCMLLTERLRPLLVMASPDELQAEGEMARLWREKSGYPEKGEFEAMKARQGKMREMAGRATLVVYPIRTGRGVDREGAENLVSLLNERELCRARLAPESIQLEVKPDSNEQRVLWDMAKAFQSSVRNKAITTDYALYADYLMDSRGDGVGAVHFVVCNRQGEFVIVDFQNDHHGDFQSISPKSLKDCNRLVARRLAGYLK